MERIVVATDGSEHADRAVTLASDLAAKYGAALLALHVIQDRPLSTAERHMAEIEFSEEIKKFPGSGLLDSVPDIGNGGLTMRNVVRQHETADRVLRTMIGETVLKRAAHTAHAKGVDAVETELTDGDAATQILETAKAKDADLIVLGSRGLGAMGEFFLGSVSHKVNLFSVVNVLTVK